ncbi:hypothetical protein BDM02DRAFT_3130717 [Thelephora ganbajun]|uniref:Uncharacterized protein n=1 Tax=Thelephora ganbajun TaxID=370292 RepID=A0ACB6Z8J4_THEGA|nr:hypothetical protein BDM02DRAFT_3130717 [Thelephora ganbajun]
MPFVHEPLFIVKVQFAQLFPLLRLFAILFPSLECSPPRSFACPFGRTGRTTVVHGNRSPTLGRLFSPSGRSRKYADLGGLVLRGETPSRHASWRQEREFLQRGSTFPMSPSSREITIRNAANEDKYGLRPAQYTTGLNRSIGSSEAWNLGYWYPSTDKRIPLT